MNFLNQVLSEYFTHWKKLSNTYFAVNEIFSWSYNRTIGRQRTFGNVVLRPLWPETKIKMGEKARWQIKFLYSESWEYPWRLSEGVSSGTEFLQCLSSQDFTFSLEGTWDKICFKYIWEFQWWLHMTSKTENERIKPTGKCVCCQHVLQMRSFDQWDFARKVRK